MAMLYIFPASIYKGTYAPHNLDEMEIEEPEQNESNPANTPRTATFSLTVKSFVLHNIVVTVTFTRMQTGLANPSAVSTNGAVWDYSNNTATTPIYEAKWSRPQININTTTEFSIDFNVGATTGTFFAWFRVDCDELSTKAECPIQHIVT